MKSLKILTIVLWFFVPVHFLTGQSSLQNGSFEQWKTDTVSYDFPPYNHSNHFAFLNESLAVWPVAGDQQDHAVHLESFQADGFGVFPGQIQLGFLGDPSGGIPYTDQPDSIFMRCRYDIHTDDQAVLITYFNYGSGGSAAGASFQAFTIEGAEPNWVTLGFDIPDFWRAPDSLLLAVLSSFDSAFSGANWQEGSWIEIDSIYFPDGNQALPNNGFEQSMPVEARDPVGWYSGNGFIEVFGGTHTSATEETLSVVDGNSALRIETQVFDLNGEDQIISYITNGQGFGSNGPVGGQMVPQGADLSHLSGFYKYEPVGLDTAFLLISFWETSTGQESSFARALPPSTDYEYFELESNMAFQPDSFIMTFGASDQFNIVSAGSTSIGSVLWMDSLFFDGVNALREPVEVFESNVRLFPNPATDHVTIEFEPLLGESYQVILYNAMGQQVYQQNIPSLWDENIQRLHIPLDPLPTGWFSCSIQNEYGDLLISKKFLKK